METPHKVGVMVGVRAARHRKEGRHSLAGPWGEDAPSTLCSATSAPAGSRRAKS